MSQKPLKPYLVTGAAGFTGGHLVRLLLERGLPVRAMVRNLKEASHLEAQGAQVVEADLKNKESLRKAVEGVEGVFHIAALFRQAGLPDQEYVDVNVEGTRSLIEASIEAGVSRFVHCSTVGVHGHVANPPAAENYPYNPSDIYQETKMQGELVALEAFASKRIDGVVIRPAMIYGPGDTRMLKLFKMIAKKRFFYIGSGEMHVHFIDVRDLVHAFWLAMQYKQLTNEVFIIAGKRSVMLKEMVRLISKELEVPVPWLRVPVKPLQWLGSICEAICTPLKINPPIYRRRVDFFTKNRHFDGSKAEQLLGFQASATLEKEIEDIVSWYRENNYLPQVAKPFPTMVRTLDGKIKYWNVHSEKAYGWNSDNAVGSVSHSLLKTEFPCSLDDINNELMEKRVWEGSLIHTTRDGNKVTVNSRWLLKPPANGDEPEVLEINNPQGTQGDFLMIGGHVNQLVASVAYPIIDLMPLSI